MRIKLVSIHVDDQTKAAAFYADVLGFVKKHDLEVGGGFRWLTFVSPEGHDDVELVLEPNANPAAKAYQAALLEQGSRRPHSRSMTWTRSTGACSRPGLRSARRPRRRGR